MVWEGTVVSQLFDNSKRWKILDKCVEGNQATVYYNPKNQYQFVLERGSLPMFPGRSWISILFAGLILASVSLLLLVCFIRGDSSMNFCFVLLVAIFA